MLLLVVLFSSPILGQGGLTFYIFGDHTCGPCRDLEKMLSNIYGREKVFYCDVSTSLICAEKLGILYVNFLPDLGDRTVLPTVLVRGDRVVGIFVNVLDFDFWRNLPSEVRKLSDDQILIFKPDGVVVVASLAPDVKDFIEKEALNIDMAARALLTSQKPAMDWRDWAFTLYSILFVIAMLIVLAPSQLLQPRRLPEPEGAQ